jgi:hypothetical protein
LYTPTDSLAEEMESSYDYNDISGHTTNAERAYDGDILSCAEISTSVDAYPSIIYFWDLPPDDYKLEGFFIALSESNSAKDDRWELQYSVDGGSNWLDLSVSESQPDVYVQNAIIQDLRLRINTDKVKKEDGAFLSLYEISAIVTENTTVLPDEPIIHQGDFGLYLGVQNEDFYSITGSVGGDTRAQAIAIDDTFMYVAGQVPLGTVRGWRIEKRNLNDGELIEQAISANGGEPYDIVLDGNAIFLVGDAYIDGRYCWHIEKRNTSDLLLNSTFGVDGILMVDPNEYSGRAYAAVIVDGSLIVVGSDYSDGQARWLVEKRNAANGSFQGSVTSDPGNGDDIPYAMATNGTHLFIGGYETAIIGKNRKAITTIRPRIEKRFIDDLSMMSFANSEYTSDALATVTALAVDNDNLYVAGTYELGFFDTAWIVEKYDSDSLTCKGSLVQNNGWDERPLALAVHSNPKQLFAAGFSADLGSGGDTAWLIKIWTLDGTWTQEVPPTLSYTVLHDINSQDNDRAYAVALDANYMYLAGYENSGLPKWHIQKRDVSDGSLDSLYLNDGSHVPPGDPLYISNVLQNNHFRCKVLLDIDPESTTGLELEGRSFKLQYREDGCSVDGYNDVSSSSPIAFAKMGWHGMQVPPPVNPYDPFYGDPSILYQIFVEENNFTNSISQLDPGQSGLWDFSLKGYVPGTYCLRIVMIDDENPWIYEELDALNPIEIIIE